MVLETIVQDASTMAYKPDQQKVQQWAQSAHSATDLHGQENQVLVRFVDEEEGAFLNKTYRYKDYATNVLSFPFQMSKEVGIDLLGDVIICAPVVQREADEQNKSLEAHWSHMVVHGVLHLCGYRHDDDTSATRMESLEIEILAGFGYPNPYTEYHG